MDLSTDGIYFFNKGKFFELSNYWMNKEKTPIFSTEEGDFISSEHYYQFFKFCYEGANNETLEYAELIKKARTANDAKLLAGQKIKGGYQSHLNNVIKDYKDKAILNPKWEEIKINVMRNALCYKFSQNEHCRKILIKTGDKMLYEDSPYDDFWGIGKHKTGQNWLGKLLVELRDIILQGKQ